MDRLQKLVKQYQPKTKADIDNLKKRIAKGRKYFADKNIITLPKEHRAAYLHLQAMEGALELYNWLK